MVYEFYLKRDFFFLKKERRQTQGLIASVHFLLGNQLCLTWDKVAFSRTLEKLRNLVIPNSRFMKPTFMKFWPTQYFKKQRNNIIKLYIYVCMEKFHSKR